jgi:hypothetical protein
MRTALPVFAQSLLLVSGVILLVDFSWATSADSSQIEDNMLLPTSTRVGGLESSQESSDHRLLGSQTPIGIDLFLPQGLADLLGSPQAGV